MRLRIAIAMLEFVLFISNILPKLKAAITLNKIVMC